MIRIRKANEAPRVDYSESVNDHWVTLKEEARASVKIQRSEFIGIAFPCETEEGFDRKLAEIAREFFDATHHCWALRLFSGGELRSRSSDAGEPSGTAGRPIAMAIEGSNLSDTGVVVVRYYGGVKLGTGGLGRAYRDAAQLALEAASIEDRYLYDAIVVEVPFSRVSTVYRMINSPDLLLDGEEYGEVNLFTLRVRLTRVDEVKEQLERERLTIRSVDRGPHAVPS